MIETNLQNTDIAARAFSMLFGNNWWESAALEMSNSPLIEILRYLNVCLFSWIALYGVYFAVVGSVSTANEGHVGGKNNNITWWTLRMGLGLGMTAPLVKGGFSALQVLLLTFLGYACSGANDVFFTGLDFLGKSNFIEMSAEAPPHIREEGKEIANLLLKSGVVQLSEAKRSLELSKELKKHGAPTSVKPWTNFSPVAINSHSSALKSDNKHDYWRIEFTIPPDRGLNPADLGVIKIPGQANDPLMLAKKNGVIAMHRVISPIAKKIVSGENVTDQWLTTAVSTYESHVMRVLKNMASYYPQLKPTQQVFELKEKARSLGWMSAGAWPLYMASISQEASELRSSRVTVVPIKDSVISAKLNEPHYNKTARLLITTKSEFEHQQDPSELNKTIKESVVAGNSSSVIDDVLNAIQFKTALKSLIHQLEHESPLIVIPKLGHLILDAGLVFWNTGLAITVAAGASDGWDSSIIGQGVSFFTGGISGGVIGGASAGVGYIASWLKGLSVGLLAIGALFAYLFPALPLIFWALAMVNFLLLVVETMVAAPFWAAAHAWSTKESGFAGERGSQGYLQLLEILFRPLLYVMSFFTIILLMNVMGFLLARLFETFYFSYTNADISAGFSHTGVITSLFMMIMVGGLYVYMFTLLCTEGYSHLPQKVMRWIGNEASSIGIAQQAESFKQMVVAGATHAMRGRSGNSLSGAYNRTASSSESNPHSPGSVPESSYGNGVIGSNLKKPNK